MPVQSHATVPPPTAMRRMNVRREICVIASSLHKSFSCRCAAHVTWRRADSLARPGLGLREIIPQGGAGAGAAVVRFCHICLIGFIWLDDTAPPLRPHMAARSPG